jgi:hypothetical protein
MENDMKADVAGIEPKPAAFEVDALAIARDLDELFMMLRTDIGACVDTARNVVSMSTIEEGSYERLLDLYSRLLLLAGRMDATNQELQKQMSEIVGYRAQAHRDRSNATSH